MAKMHILLSTFNGERYLRSQLDSLMDQTYKDWILTVRDDGSSDQTLAILSEYQQGYPERIFLLQDDARGLGAKGNFARLLEQSTADYVAFCDQDDVWLPIKLELTLNRMVELEHRYGQHIPILVHTDLEIVDAHLNTMAASYWKYQYLKPHSNWKGLLLQNVVTGCTSLINRSLYQMARPIPDGAIMHDWWLALIAALLGRVEAVDSPTVRYRQHDANDTGAQLWEFGLILNKLAGLSEVRQSVLNTQRQAADLVERFSAQLDPYTCQMLRNYADLSNKPFWDRKRFLLQNDLRMIGLARNLGLLWVI